MLGKIKVRRRQGMTIVEVVILMVVLGLSIWAVMSTAIWASQVQASTRQDMGMRVFASSWFEIAESLPAVSFDSGNFTGTIASVIQKVKGQADTPFNIEAFLDRSARGAHTIRLVLSPGGKKSSVTYTRGVNSISHETVLNDDF